MSDSFHFIVLHLSAGKPRTNRTLFSMQKCVTFKIGTSKVSGIAYHISVSNNKKKNLTTMIIIVLIGVVAVLLVVAVVVVMVVVFSNSRGMCVKRSLSI